MGTPFKIGRTDLPASDGGSESHGIRSAVGNLNEAEIWRRFKSGHEEAIVYIYQKYSQELFRFAVQYTDRDDAKDAIQELFLVLLKRKSFLGEVSAVRPYLYRSLYRVIRDRRIKSKNHKLIDLTCDDKLPGRHLSHEEGIISQEHIQTRLNQVRAALQELSVKQKEAMLLYYYEGLTQAEIADVMEMKNKDAARKLIYRALDKIKELIR